MPLDADEDEDALVLNTTDGVLLLDLPPAIVDLPPLAAFPLLPLLKFSGLMRSLLIAPGEEGLPIPNPIPIPPAPPLLLLLVTSLAAAFKFFNK